MKSFLFALLIAALLCGNIGTASAQTEGPQGQPDLVIQVEFDGDYINVRVRNVGSGYAGGFYSFLYIDPTVQPPQVGTPDTSYSFLFGLAAGQSYTWSYGPWTPSSGQQHVLWVWVDRDDQVDEVDDLNNFGFFLIEDPTPTPTPVPSRPLFLPLVMRGFIGTIIIPPGEGTPTPTATPPVIYTPDSRTMVTATPTATSTP